MLFVTIEKSIIPIEHHMLFGAVYFKIQCIEYTYNYGYKFHFSLSGTFALHSKTIALNTKGIVSSMFQIWKFRIY